MIKITEPVICRSVGRDPDNPSNREKGCNTEQTLELKKDGISNTLTTVHKDNLIIEPKIKIVGHMDGYEQAGRVYNPSGIACTLRSRDYKDPMQILEYKINEPKIKRLGNLYDENAGGARAGNTYDPDGLAPALQTAQGGNRQPLMYENYRIRKLTPKECFRLMGFTDEEFNRIQGISNTQLYKMAGNSICVPVLEAIFRNLFEKE